MKTVLIAGATGYLGRHVVKACKTHGYQTHALVRNRDKLGDAQAFIDHVHIGQVTQPDSLKGVCDGVDVVFSSVGITRQKDGLSFMDVDYQGNRNLLDEALRAGVQKFVYVSVFNGPNLLHLDIVKAHEAFVDALKASGIDYAIIRPTGYFSDMGEFLSMAKRGRVYLVGSGNNQMNPIHGADLAAACVGAFESPNAEFDVGGPTVYSYREMAELAFSSQGKAPRIRSVPLWVMKASVVIARLLNRHQGALLAFFVEMMSNDMVAPRTGTHALGAHFKELETNKF